MPVAKSSPANSNDSASAYEDDGSANYETHDTQNNLDSYANSIRGTVNDLNHTTPLNELKFETQVGNFEEEGDDDEPEDGKKTKSGRRKINIEYIKDKSRRHITFSKRKNGIMKKAYELATLTGTQVLLLVVSESGLVYTFTTAKLSPVVKTDEGQLIVQKCLSNQYEIDEDGYAPVQDRTSKRGRPSRAETEGHSLKRQRTTDFSETSLAEATKATMRAPIAPVPAVPNLDSVAGGHQQPQNLAHFNRAPQAAHAPHAPQDEYTPRTAFYDSSYLDFNNIAPTEVMPNPLQQYQNTAAAAAAAGAYEYVGN